MNFNNLNLNSKMFGKANQGQGLDILGLSQQSQGDHLAMVGEGQRDFAGLLAQIGQAGEGLADLLGGSKIENTENVFELIDQFPSEFKLNFLEELKQDLPKVVEGLELQGNTDKNLLANPTEIITKIQEVIDLVKDGGEKIADAFKNVFDGGVFDAVFKAEDSIANDKVLASLSDKLKALSAKSEGKSLQSAEQVATDENIELHNFMKNQKAAMPKKASQLKQFAAFNKQDQVIQKNQSAVQNNLVQNVSEQDLNLQNMMRKNRANPYAKAQNNDNFFKANEVMAPTEGQNSQNLMYSFMGQNGSQMNMDFMASQNMMENTMVEGSSEVNQSQALDLNQMIESSNSKTELIKNVTNYLEQVQFNNQTELDVAVKHSELGEFNIQVSKDVTTNNLDLQIKAMTEDGINFFQENEAELVKTLNDKGIKLATLKIGSKGESLMSGSSDKSDSGSMNQQNRGDQSQHFSQHKGQQGKDQGGQQRRRELWQRYQEQMAS